MYFVSLDGSCPANLRTYSLKYGFPIDASFSDAIPHIGTGQFDLKYHTAIFGVKNATLMNIQFGKSLSLYAGQPKQKAGFSSLLRQDPVFLLKTLNKRKNKNFRSILASNDLPH